MSVTTVSSGVVSSGLIVTSGSSLEILAGGEALGTIVSGSGSQIVFGVADDTVLSGQAGPTAGSRIVFATQYVSSGGIASATTINDFAYQSVGRGGTASATAMLNGGRQYVYGTAIDTVLSGVDVNDGPYIAYSEQDVFNHGLVKSVTVESGAIEVISSGGTGQDIVISSGGAAWCFLAVSRATSRF